MIQVEKLSKSYGPVTVLQGISLTCGDGSVHALTGENGAGKSTLMKLIGGVTHPNTGSITLNGEIVQFKTPRDALAGGISTVFQEFSLIENLTITESIFLGHEQSTRAGLSLSEMEKKTREVLSHVGLEVHPDRMISTLTVAEQQMVEIARGISANASVFIFDEPTAALGDEDVTKLKRLIRELQAAGKCIFYVSHRLDEIFDLCDTVTVLKDGQHVATRPISDLTVDALVSLMVGRELGDWFPPKQTKTDRMALKVVDLVCGDQEKGVSFQVNQGEILGIAGLEGQGQREIIRALAGAEPAYSGEMHSHANGVDHKHRLNAGVGEQVDAGVAFVPEDRKNEGLYLTLPINENILLGCHQKRGFWSLVQNTNRIVTEMMVSMNIAASSDKQVVGTLSGGNQQKVMIGRWLASGAHVYLIEEPTRGVDVGAKAEIYVLLRELVSEGKSVVVLSREMNELIGMCDRILVVRGGAIVAEMDADNATEAGILHAAITDTTETEAAA
ncbi:sugar ABC transporter ATP-binding protein [Phaeobacter sp. LSS9]|uniref:sugar ABC transporter ATP-binding protein n=1 Tax=unclassified Phaeobacter TaxID=2621772 RepID=UPI000E46F40F|nr:sugar ABC transporter ATP-binding protein [Phaeobacter sp. LSS9]AXT36251.1 sugar ABC transporter ATP-binding protein [Phaeobacter sp. LSS9]